VIINGILSYMLTPGKWLDTQGFWDGFFNPTYFPSLVFRTAAAVMIAGLFGYITVVFSKDPDFRKKMLSYCTWWLLIPIPVLILSGFWYYYAIPEGIRYTAFDLNAQSQLFITGFIATSVLIFVLGVLFFLRMNLSVQRVMVFLIVLIGLGWYGSFEYLREYARKPYIIHGYMFSTSILEKDADKLNAEGILAHAKWTAISEVTDENMAEAGREIFNLECLACHTIRGVKNDIVDKTKDLTYMGILSHIYGQGKILDYMPRFVGTEREMEALATFIAVDLNQKDKITTVSQFDPEPVENEIPPFDMENDKYVLLAWNDLGMHCISDCDPWFIFLPPANTLEAQLIKRGLLPEIIMDGVELQYRVQQGYENPSQHSRFWEFAESYFGVKLEPNVGLAGKGMSGTFDWSDDRMSYIAEMIPVLPYRDDGTFNPYPQFYVDAVDIETREVLVSTKVVAPASTEMGCRNCHGGGWSFNGVSGVADETAINILKTHDRINGTDLYASALGGMPVLCQSCHADPALGAEGKPGHNNFSASMHGWHANYMHVQGASACVMCHPASPKGNTRCNRGLHAQLGLNCVSCHGTMYDHAAGLLNAQQGTNSSARLLRNLETVMVASAGEVSPRMPWVQEPDCLGCHVDFDPPGENPSAFNKWTDGFQGLYRIRTDEIGIRCQACHNSTHSLYPAINVFGKHWDNTQPMQYGKMPLPIGANNSCEVCHIDKMQDAVHHWNMEGPFRNTQLLH